MKEEGKSLPFFVFYLFNSNSSYICATNSGEIELEKKAHFALFRMVNLDNSL